MKCEPLGSQSSASLRFTMDNEQWTKKAALHLR